MSAFLGALTAVVLAIANAVGCELLGKRWYYSTEKWATLMRRYQKLDDDASKRRLDALHKADPKRRERELKAALTAEKDRDKVGVQLQGMKFWANAISIAGMLTAVTTLNMLFKGLVVMELPFGSPFPFRLLTHRGLEGDDYREVSVIFVYVLATMFVRKLVARKLGTELPKSLQERMSFAGRMKELEEKSQQE